MILLPLLTAISLQPEQPLAASSAIAQAESGESSNGLVRPAATAGKPAAVAAAAGQSLERLLPSFFAFWLLGVAGLSLYNLMGWRQALRLSRTGSCKLDRYWQTCRERLCRQLGIRRPVRLLSTSRVEVPIVVGWLRPAVLVPMSALSGLTPDQIDALLAHELAHVRRHDYLVNLMQAALETLLFFHPAVWWLSHQVRIEREHCCDDIAVQACGNRAVYVRALADMEGLRQAVCQHALAASGGSLLNRVRRLLGRAPRHSFHAEIWLTSAVPVLLLLTLATLVGLSPVSAALPAASSESLVPVLPSNQESELSGTWESKRDNGKVRLRLAVDADDDTWQSNLTFAESSYSGLDSAAPELRRDAGTIVLNGTIPPESSGSGRFIFTPSPEYQEELSRLGLGEISTERAFALMVHDLSLEFIHGLRKLYDDADLDQLLACRIHDVSAEYAEEMRRAGFGDPGLEQLLAYRIHDITPEYAEKMRQAGFGELDNEQLLAYRIHDITPEYAEKMRQAGFGELDAEELLAYRIHDITPEYAEEMHQAGFGELDSEELLAYRIHDITPEYAEKMRQAGFGEIDAEELLAYRIHDITPEYAEEMRQAGFSELDPEQLLACRIHDVTAKFAEDLSEAGVSDLTLESLLAYRIHGVSSSFIDKLAELGYQGLSGDTLLQMRIHSVTSDFIREANADGSHTAAEELIRMRIHRR
jgi:beta-lactamase regulating signal transducer with metallopeptidase domain/DNA-directed RNA polymerase subunit F